MVCMEYRRDVMRIFLLIFTVLIFHTAAFANNSNEYIEHVLNKNLPLSQRLDACDAIRNLPENTTTLTKTQLYTLKAAARYKKYSLIAQARKQNTGNVNAAWHYILALGQGGEFYIDKYSKATLVLNDFYGGGSVAKAKLNNERYFNMYMLGIFEYVTGNTTIGTATMNEALSNLKNNPFGKKDVPDLIKVFEVTKAFCDDNLKPEDIVRILTSATTTTSSIANSNTVKQTPPLVSSAPKSDGNSTVKKPYVLTEKGRILLYTDKHRNKIDTYLRSTPAKVVKVKNSSPDKIVKVSFTINKNGELVSCKIINSSGIEAADKDAVDVIKQMEFEPFPVEIKKDSMVLEAIFSYGKKYQRYCHLYSPLVINTGSGTGGAGTGSK